MRRSLRARALTSRQPPLPDSATFEVSINSMQPKLEKQTAGNGSSTEPNASVPDCMGSDPGRYPVSSDPNPAVMCTAVAAAVDRNTAVTDDADRGLTHSASSSAAVNETHPADSELIVYPVDSAMVQSVISERSPPPQGRVSVSDVMKGRSVIADETHPVNSELAHSLCKLIGVIHCDINCPSSNESDCMHLHNPECSSNSAGTVVNCTPEWFGFGRHFGVRGLIR